MTCASGPSGDGSRAESTVPAVEDVAALVLNSVRVNGRAALVSAFPDRLVIVDPSGTQVIPMGDLARITHKAGLRTGRIGIVTVNGDEIADSRAARRARRRRHTRSWCGWPQLPSESDSSSRSIHTMSRIGMPPSARSAGYPFSAVKKSRSMCVSRNPHRW